MEDMNLQCCDCKEQFVFDAHEQQFFASVGLVNLPKRCSKCRLIGRMRRAGKQDTDFAEVACADCGKQTAVPFKPNGHAPVYCTPCFKTRKKEQVQASQAS